MSYYIVVFSPFAIKKFPALSPIMTVEKTQDDLFRNMTRMTVQYAEAVFDADRMKFEKCRYSFQSEQFISMMTEMWRQESIAPVLTKENMPDYMKSIGSVA